MASLDEMTRTADRGDGFNRERERRRSLVGEPDGASNPVFTLRSESAGKACGFYLQGELDLRDFEAVDQALRDAAQRANQITFDLTDLTFMDVWGLRLLLEADARARADSHSMRVIGATGEVKKVMEMTGTFDRLSSDS
jgi:anti-sigma B factor antagonist